jgi:hypothetical protein
LSGLAELTGALIARAFTSRNSLYAAENGFASSITKQSRIQKVMKNLVITIATRSKMKPTIHFGRTSIAIPFSRRMK